MRADTRLSSMLHLLLHMAEAGHSMTSEQLAAYMRTNAVVVRRTMAGLREAKLVQSEKGHGGGWRLARRLEDISLADIHSALGSPALFAFGNRNDDPKCLVERAVNSALAETMADAETMILTRLGSISLSDIAEDYRGRVPAGCGRQHGDRHDA